MADPALTAALGAPVTTMFVAVRFAFPARTVRLLDGAGQVTFGGETYIGLDDEFGALDTVEVISGSDGEEAPEFAITLNPSSAASAATLANPAMQGAEVRVYVGAVDPATGAVIGTPELRVIGEVDVPTLNATKDERTVEYTVISAFDRLFDEDEGARATDGFHQSIWPGEAGLSEMTGTVKNLYWGGDPPPVTRAAQGGTNWSTVTGLAGLGGRR